MKNFISETAPISKEAFNNLKSRSMVTLQYFDGQNWIDEGQWPNELIAWATLGDDNYNYRVVDEKGNVLKINSDL